MSGLPTRQGIQDHDRGRLRGGAPLSRVAGARQLSPALPPDEPSAGPDEAAVEELPDGLRTVLNRLAVGEAVRPAEIAGAFDVMCGLDTPMRDVLLGSLFTAVLCRGPRVDEVEALVRMALTIDDAGAAEVVTGGSCPVLLLAGSGKKGIRTLNVSTPAALVAAAVGARVIKVGSAATSSALGSRDLVRALGLPERWTAAGVRADLDSCGFAFVAVEPAIPVVDRLYGGRFHTPNPFSFGLAPLASPVRGDVTVFGLSHPRVDVAADVLRRFGMDHVDVLSTRLSGGYYMDEIGTVGEVSCCRVRDGVVGPVEVDAIEHRLPRGMSAEDSPIPRRPTEMVDRTVELLAGGGVDSHRAVVAINSAFLLLRSGVTRSLVEGRELAEDALRSGSALTRLPTTAL